MAEPTTPTGKRLMADPDVRAGFTLVMLSDILAIEREAAEQYAEQVTPFVFWQGRCGHVWKFADHKECPVCVEIREDVAQERALADQLAEVLRDVLKMRYGEVLGDPVGTLKRVDAVLAAYDEARK